MANEKSNKYDQRKTDKIYEANNMGYTRITDESTFTQRTQNVHLPCDTLSNVIHHERWCDEPFSKFALIPPL